MSNDKCIILNDESLGQVDYSHFFACVDSIILNDSNLLWNLA